MRWILPAAGLTALLTCFVLISDAWAIDAVDGSLHRAPSSLHAASVRPGGTTAQTHVGEDLSVAAQRVAWDDGGCSVLDALTGQRGVMLKFCGVSAFRKPAPRPTKVPMPNRRA